MHLCIEKGLEMSIVSVIIPVHNTADYLRKCVESVRDQSLKDIEIILVDNLSTDDSPAMCDAYAKLDSRIKVLICLLQIFRRHAMPVLKKQHLNI